MGKGKSMYKGKKGETPKPTFSDKFLRCPHCFARKGVPGEADIPSLLVMEFVRLKVDQGPNPEIAKAVRCVGEKCGFVLRVSILPEGKRLDLERAPIFNLLKKYRGTPTFTLEEIKLAKSFVPEVSSDKEEYKGPLLSNLGEEVPF